MSRIIGAIFAVAGVLLSWTSDKYSLLSNLQVYSLLILSVLWLILANLEDINRKSK
jgi:hypothetical protein